MKARHLLALLAAASLILALAGCGGGGGGGGTGGGGITTTTTITGKVLDVSGNAIVGAEVLADTGGKSILRDTTDTNGRYDIAGVPVGAGFNLSVTAGSMMRTYDGLRVGAPYGGSSSMDIVLNPDTPPAGSTISMEPADTDIAVGTRPSYSVKLSYNIGDTPITLDDYPAVWTVSGGTGKMTGGSHFTITPGAVGATVRVRATVLLEGGGVAVKELVLPVVNPGGDDDGPPVIPPDEGS